ncbi:MAG: ABC transporter substrate-binding protein [Gemmatimonadota bacterium]|nr:ABC transporter substrate-binding protein [Gemmatimonadota bacterium]MDH5758571.1 ABC transporter substrate-binding protein [Gemmatimonadota bacterium]
MIEAACSCVGRFARVVVAVALLGSACTPPPDYPLVIGSLDWIGYRPLFLAQEVGLLPADQVHLVELSSETEEIRAFENGQIDVVCVTLEGALQLADAGVDIRIVLVMDVSHGADVVIGGPGIEDISGLVGARVGVETTALGAYVITRALEFAHLTLDGVEIVPLELHEHEQAFLNGSVDAVTTFEPVASRLREEGGRTLFSSRDIPGEIVDVLVVRASALEGRRQAVVSLIRAWVAALEYMESRPDEATAALARMSALSVEDYVRAQRGLRFAGRAENEAFLVGPNGLTSTVERVGAVMVEWGLLREAPSPETLLDGSIIGELGHP